MKAPPNVNADFETDGLEGVRFHAWRPEWRGKSGRDDAVKCFAEALSRSFPSLTLPGFPSFIRDFCLGFCPADSSQAALY